MWNVIQLIAPKSGIEIVKFYTYFQAHFTFLSIFAKK